MAKVEREVASGSANRRRRDRVRESLSVSLRLPGVRRGVRGRLRDYDAEGACIETDRPPEVGQPLRVAFRIPPSLSEEFQALSCRLPARVRAVRAAPERLDASFDVVVEWERPLAELIERSITVHQREIGAMLAVIVLLMVWLRWNSLQWFWYMPALYLYSTLISAYFLTRFVIAWKHTNPTMTGHEPSVTIVVSVRNEEAAIERTVEACFLTDYPPEKREIIVVNDGSTDRTGELLEGLKLRFTELRVFHIPPSGKRHGMATGVRNAKGEIIVFIDSDTFVTRSALRHIVCGFEDPTLGASAGHTDVENSRVNALTGLQDVRYILGFRVMKAAESFFNVVTCCPGCLSAYRKSYLQKILDRWLNQRFLGAQATFGDDRSLTNYILRDYRVIYNENAKATTLVPETWKRFLTQQVRWKKSWLRETLIAGGFIWRKHPMGAIGFYVAAVCSVTSPLFVLRTVSIAWSQSDTGFIYYVIGLLMIGMFQCLYVLRKRPQARWLLGMLVVAIQVVILGPQSYYALLTMRRNHWGTR